MINSCTFQIILNIYFKRNQWLISSSFCNTVILSSCHTNKAYWCWCCWVGFLRFFGPKTGINFAHFGLESGMVFEGTWVGGGGKWVRKKEKCANMKWIWRIYFFCLRSYLGNDDIISAYRPGLKMGMDFSGLVWKRVWKMTFLVWNRVRIWGTGRHAPTRNFQGYPPGFLYPLIWLSIKRTLSAGPKAICLRESWQQCLACTWLILSWMYLIRSLLA